MSVIRYGAGPESQSVYDLVVASESMLRAATSSSFAGLRCDVPVVVCDDEGFDALIPPEVGMDRIDRLDPAPDEAASGFELLGVATRWRWSEPRVTIADGEPVVLLSAGRIHHAAGEAGQPLAAVTDFVVLHEFAHHMSGTLDDRVPEPDQIRRDEHLAQVGAWNAITCLPAATNVEARMSAMWAISRRAPRCYRMYLDLPAVETTRLPRTTRGVHWVVTTPSYNDLRLAHFLAIPVDEPRPAVSDIVWVANTLTAEHLERLRRFEGTPLNSDELGTRLVAFHDLPQIGYEGQPTRGQQGVIGPYVIVDVQGEELHLRSCGTLTRIDWTFDESRPALGHMTQPPDELLAKST